MGIAVLATTCGCHAFTKIFQHLACILAFNFPTSNTFFNAFAPHFVALSGLILAIIGLALTATTFVVGALPPTVITPALVNLYAFFCFGHQLAGLIAGQQALLNSVIQPSFYCFQIKSVCLFTRSTLFAGGKLAVLRTATVTATL